MNRASRFNSSYLLLVTNIDVSFVKFFFNNNLMSGCIIVPFKSWLQLSSVGQVVMRSLVTFFFQSKG